MQLQHMQNRPCQPPHLGHLGGIRGAEPHRTQRALQRCSGVGGGEGGRFRQARRTATLCKLACAHGWQCPSQFPPCTCAPLGPSPCAAAASPCWFWDSTVEACCSATASSRMSSSARAV